MADEDFNASMDALRQKFSGARRGVVARPGGQLRKSSSVSSCSGSASIDRMAVESVHSGIVVSLDSDCRAYRAEISQLKAFVAELQDQARPAAEIHAEKEELAKEVRMLRTQVSDAARQREALNARLAKLVQEASALPSTSAAASSLRLSKAASGAHPSTRVDKHSKEEVDRDGAGHANERATIAQLEARLEAATGCQRASDEQIRQLTSRVAELGARTTSAVDESRSCQARAEAAERRVDAAEARADAADTKAAAAETKAEAAQARAEAAEARAEAAEARAEAADAVEAQAREAGCQSVREAPAHAQMLARISELEREREGAEVSRAASVVERDRERQAAAALADEMARRTGELEAAYATRVEEVGSLRAALDSVHAELEHCRARPMVPTTESALRSSPKALLQPMARPLDPAASQQLSKTHARLEGLSAENAQLREQVEHLSIMLSADGPRKSSAATSPLKLSGR